MTMNLLVVQATLLVLYITIGPGVFSDAQELVPNETEERIENSLRTLKKLRTTREGLESLQQVLQDIDEDLRHQQLSACAVSGGMSEHCLDEILFNQLNLEEWLQGGFSPGRRDLHEKRKRTSPSSAVNHHNPPGKSLDGITRKRKGLDILRRILNEMDTDLMTQQKRTCVVDLGGHCSTESAAAAANQWMFLQSPYSPGKRRRRDTSMLLHKLLNGKE